MRLLVAAVLPFALATSAVAACNTDPRPAGRCFLVHGRITVQANMRPYLWPVGSRRLIGIASPGGAIDMPEEIQRLFASPTSFDKAVFGDFEVCPYTRHQPGRMQLACIASVRHLTLRDRRH